MKKIISQSLALSSLGVNIHVIMLGYHDEVYPEYDFLHIVPISRASNHSVVNRVRRVMIARGRLFSLLRSLNSGDILYYRRISSFPLYYPINYFKPFRKCSLITEHQSIAHKELSITGKTFFSILEQFFSPFIIHQSDAIIGVTEEITQYEISSILNRNIPHVTIGNGVNVHEYPVRSNKQLRTDCYELICVAEFHLWHGLDRLIEGLNRYHGKIPIILHLVGMGTEIFNLPQKNGNNSQSYSIQIHGFLTGNTLDILYNQCHMAVGSLAIHRKGLRQTSELKGREYCARGIPFVIACQDSDFPQEFPYFLQFPSNETPIDVQRIISFIHHILLDSEHPQKMREYAEKNLDWEIKMKRLKGFLDELPVKSKKK